MHTLSVLCHVVTQVSFVLPNRILTLSFTYWILTLLSICSLWCIMCQFALMSVMLSTTVWKALLWLLLLTYLMILMKNPTVFSGLICSTWLLTIPNGRANTILELRLTLMWIFLLICNTVAMITSIILLLLLFVWACYVMGVHFQCDNNSTS